MPTIKPLKDAGGAKAVVYSGAGRNFDWTMTLTDSAGAAVDVSGWSIRALVKQKLSDPDADALLPATACSIGNGPAGLFTVPLAAATVTGEAADAVMVIWRETGGAKKVLCQYYVDVLSSALDW